MKYYFYYLIILVLLIVAELLYFKLAERFGIVDKPSSRSSHNRVVLRGGGIIIPLGVLMGALFFGFSYPWFVLGLVIISAVSFWDDVHSIPGMARLAVQFVAMFFMFYEMEILHLNNWWIVLVAIIVSVGVTNAFNFMDGINGMTGGYSLVVLLPLIYQNSKFGFISMELLVCTLLADVVFCFFNFRKKAKCFAGDVGAVSVAFIVVFSI